jgi:cytochrome c
MSLSKLSVLVGASLGLYSFIHQPAPTSTYPSEVFTKVDTLNRPDENRFTKTVLSNDLNEPMELAVAPDGRVFFVERAGKFYVYEPAKRKLVYYMIFP